VGDESDGGGDDNPCPHLDNCEMFALFKHSGTLAVWQINYCKGQFGNCQRYQLATKGERIPRSLLPNGRSLGGGS
jgi:hypothetical protein